VTRALYRDDLAHIHDVRFGDVARSAAPVLLEALRRSGLEDGLVVDLGCGSGILAEVITAAGYDVLGIDVSRSMLRIARRRAPEAAFRLGSLYDVEIPRAAAITGIGEAFNYFDRRPVSESRLAKHLRRIHQALLPGGVLLFDLAAPGRVPGGKVTQKHFEERDWAIMVTNEADEKRRILTRRVTSFRKVGRAYRRGTETHRQRLFERAVVLDLLRAAGFRARALASYGALPFPRGLVGYLASKEASAR
jgi:SAM-dependent methyltransferase